MGQTCWVEGAVCAVTHRTTESGILGGTGVQRQCGQRWDWEVKKALCHAKVDAFSGRPGRLMASFRHVRPAFQKAQLAVLWWAGQVGDR